MLRRLPPSGSNPKSHEMVTGSIDGVLKYWKDYRPLLSAEARDAPETRSQQGHDQSIVQAVIAADGKRIISSSLDQTTRIWDVQTQTASLAQPVTTLTSYRSVYSPDGLLIVGAGGDREIRVCEAATGRLVRSIHVEGTEPLEVVAVSPENRLLATGRGRNSEPKLFELWDLESGERRSLEVKTMYVVGGVTQLAFSPSGEHLVACFGDFNLYMAQLYEKEVFPLLVFDVASGQLIQDLRGHQNAVMNITFSRDGKLLASASHDRTARIWDTATWQTIHVLANPDKSDGTTATGNGVADVAFSPDGTRLAMASHAGNVHIFNTQSGALMETLRGHAGMVEAVRFSPDGRTLVSAGADGTVRLWNAATWRQLTTIDSGSAAFRPQSLRFSPDGSQLLAAGLRTVFWSTQPSALNQPEQLAGNLKPLLKSKSLFRNRVRLLSENLQLHEALELLDSEEPLVQAGLAATRANWHASQQRWPEAAAEFAVLQKLDPDAAHAWLQSRGLLHLTRALFMQNQPALASELLAVASQQLQADGITRSNLLGIQYAQNSFPIQLTVVAANSSAARAGLRVGDVVLQVNEVELTADNLGQLSDLLGGEPGTRLQLTVQHADGDDPQQIELTKELVYSDQRFGEQIARLRSEVEQRLAENMDDLAMRQLRAELLGLLGNVPAQIADYTAAIEGLSRRPQNEVAAVLTRLYRRRGDAYLSQKQWQLAVDDYALVVTEETTDEVLLTNQASALGNALLADTDHPAKNLVDPWTRLAVAYALDDQNDLAIQSFSRALKLAVGVEAKKKIFQQAAQFDELLEQLAALHPPDEPFLQLALARMYLERGNKSSDEQRPDDARADLNRARTLLEATLDSNPENASAAEVLTEALLAIERTENEAQWTVLTPTEMKSEGGATLTLQADGSILASGKNPDQDTYQITANVAPQHIKAIRLEAIPDASLPHNGPGRWPGHGNFHLNEFRVLVNGNPHQPEGIMVSFSSPSLKEQYRNIIDGTVDGNLWSIYPRNGQQHSAMFATDLELAADDTLTVELVSSRGDYPLHNLGRFRLSVSDDPGAYANAEQRFAAIKVDDPWAKLATAYHLIGDQSALDKLLEQHPAAAAGIVELHVAAGDWPQAIEAYSKLITDQTTDVTLLSRRAAAYIATEQWDLAKADWLRVIEQQPGQLQQAFDVFRNSEQWSTAAEFGQVFIQQNLDVNSWQSLPWAAVVARAGNQQAYAELCNHMLQRFADSEDIEDAERTTKICLLLPDVIDLSQLPADKLTKGLDDGTVNDGFKPWGWTTRALFAYRSGDADSAVKYVAKSEEHKPYEFSHAMNLAVLAMAQQELNHLDEAAAALAEASQLITRLKETPNNKIHPDLLIAEILFREAKAKINGSDEPPKVNADK